MRRTDGRDFRRFCEYPTSEWGGGGAEGEILTAGLPEDVIQAGHTSTGAACRRPVAVPRGGSRAGRCGCECIAHCTCTARNDHFSATGRTTPQNDLTYSGKPITRRVKS